MANLKGTLQEFARQMFGPERRILMRNSYFPFVEPGVELSVDCFACPGNDPGCSVCRGSGWIEIMGAGMFGLHDRARFEVFAFYIGRPSASAITRRTSGISA